MLYCIAVQHYVRVRCIIIHACVEGYDTRILERVAHIRSRPIQQQSSSIWDLFDVK